MNFFKKIALAFFLSLSLGAVTSVAVAQEAAAVSADPEVANTIAHIEAGLANVDIKSSDFSAATLHLKAARDASAKIQGNDELTKQGLAAINAGMIQVKLGDVAKAQTELNKALAIYRSIK